MNIILIMVVSYMVITMSIGLYYTKKNKDIKSMFIASGDLGTILIASLVFSELVAGVGTIGNAASAFDIGISSVWANWGMSFGCFIFIPLVSKFYSSMKKTKGVVSIPEAYKYLFDDRCRVVLLFIIAIVYLLLYSTQPMAMTSILCNVFNISNVNTGTWIIAAIFIILAITGGMGGMATMNLVHAFVMILMMGIVTFKCIRSVGGVDVLITSLPRHYFSLTQPNILTVLANVLGTGISFLASANVVGAVYSSKSNKKANAGIFIAGFILIFFALCPALIGICAKVTMPEISPNSAIYAMSYSIGSIYAGFISMAIVAAIWSTAPALLIIVSTVLTKDFYLVYIKKDATDLEQVIFAKLAIIFVGIVGTAIGLHASSILGQMLGAFQIRSVVGVVLAISLLWPRVTTDAAFWSMLIGGIIAAVWQFSGQPFGVAPLWPALMACLIILIPMTLFSKEKVSPGYKMYKEAIQHCDIKEEAGLYKRQSNINNAKC